MQKVTFAAAVSALCWSAISSAEESVPAQQDDTAAARAKIAAVQRHVDAYRSRDLDRFVATFAPDAKVYANGMVATGHAEIRAFYRLNFAPDAPRITIHDSGLSGDMVYLSVGYVFPNGEEVCCSYSEYEVNNGKITYLGSSG